MGVLRYFPGSEPDREVDEAAAAHPSSGPAAVDPEPGWAVPGIAVPATSLFGESSAAAHEEVRPERARPETSAKAERISLGALSRHDVSEAEMLDKLLSRGFGPDEASDEVERLKQVGLLDDAALAERLVESLRERKGLGDSAIGPALRLRRLPTAIIEAALADSDEEASLDRLEALARERARRLGSLEPHVAERRLMAYLMRKGYSGGSARDAVRRALASQPLR